MRSRNRQCHREIRCRLSDFHAANTTGKNILIRQAQAAAFF
jgi:hypothetical protein